jgi:ankyrin repeat protein
MPLTLMKWLSAIGLTTWLATSILVAAESPLADAAEKSDRPAIRTLVKQHSDVNAPQADGMTALHWAAYRNDLETAKTLVAAKASVAVTNRYGVTPLSLACQNGSASMVELLLERGADPNTTLRGGETVLMTAARAGKPGPVSALLKRGADVNAKERRGQTALMWAAADGHTDVVELLIKAGADIHATVPDSGFTPFFFAARDGRADVVRALLKAGVDVNSTMEPRRVTGKGPRKGTSALLLAVENGHFELALDLIKAGADVNDQRSGFTPLHVMTWVRKPQRGEDDGDPAPLGSGNLNSIQFIKELVKRGADVNARLKTGRGGLGKYDTKGVTPFFMAAATADIAYMKLLVESGANPSIANVDGCTPLMAACGIGVGSAAANEVAGEEPEVLEAAQLLLKLGADVNSVDANGETAMHGAALKNLPKVVQFLADHGAKIETWNKKNRYGWTPLLIAQGHRPGNFKPSFETVDALHKVMLAAGVTPPNYERPADLNNTDWVPLKLPPKKQP